MEAALQNRFANAEIELVRGSGGVFDVTVDDEVIFSKHQSGRFPEEAEILDALSDR